MKPQKSCNTNSGIDAIFVHTVRNSCSLVSAVTTYCSTCLIAKHNKCSIANPQVLHKLDRLFMFDGV